MQASEVSQRRIPRELERYHRTCGPAGEFTFDEGTITLRHVGRRTSSEATFRHGYGRCFVRGGRYMGVIEPFDHYVMDGFDFLPEHDAERHLDDLGRVRWFAFEEGLRARCEHGEFRILPFSPDGEFNILVFSDGKRLFPIEISGSVAACKEMTADVEAVMPGMCRPVTLRWEGQDYTFKPSNHAGELGCCRIDDRTVILMTPHEPPTPDGPTMVGLDLVGGSEPRRLAVCPLRGGVIWSDEGKSAPPRAEHEPPPSEDATPPSPPSPGRTRAQARTAPGPRKGNKKQRDPRVWRAFERLLTFIIEGIPNGEAIELRKVLPPILRKLAERGIQIRGLGGTLKREMEKISGLKIPFGPRTFSGAIRVLHEHTPLVRGEARPPGRRGERVMPFDELYDPNSELARWLLAKFPDADTNAESEDPPPDPPRAAASPEASDSEPPSSPPSEEREDDGAEPHAGEAASGTGPVPPTRAPPVEPELRELFFNAHREREVREAATTQGESAASTARVPDNDDPMREQFMTGRPHFSAPLRNAARGPPSEDD